MRENLEILCIKISVTQHTTSGLSTQETHQLAIPNINIELHYGENSCYLHRDSGMGGGEGGVRLTR